MNHFVALGDSLSNDLQYIPLGQCQNDNTRFALLTLIVYLSTQSTLAALAVKSWHKQVAPIEEKFYFTFVVALTHLYNTKNETNGI